jgi:hypothetical protein
MTCVKPLLRFLLQRRGRARGDSIVACAALGEPQRLEITRWPRAIAQCNLSQRERLRWSRPQPPGCKQVP